MTVRATIFMFMKWTAVYENPSRNSSSRSPGLIRPDPVGSSYNTSFRMTFGSRLQHEGIGSTGEVGRKGGSGKSANEMDLVDEEPVDAIRLVQCIDDLKQIITPVEGVRGDIQRIVGPMQSSCRMLRRNAYHFVQSFAGMSGSNWRSPPAPG
jgi:hypothetical protein